MIKRKKRARARTKKKRKPAYDWEKIFDYSAAFGTATGVVGALYMFALGLSGAFFNFGNTMIMVLGSIYPGFSATVPGAFIGILWGFIDFFVAGFVFMFVWKTMRSR